MQVRFDSEAYHDRSQVETVMSMIKGAKVRSCEPESITANAAIFA